MKIRFAVTFVLLTTFPNITIALEPITIQSGKTIGFYWTDTQGKIFVKSTAGKTLGFYDPVSNLTKRINGQVVSQGNTIMLLLYLPNQ